MMTASFQKSRSVRHSGAAKAEPGTHASHSGSSELVQNVGWIFFNGIDYAVAGGMDPGSALCLSGMTSLHGLQAKKSNIEVHT